MCKLYLCNIRPWCAHVRDTWQQTCLKRNSNVQCAMGHLDNKWEMRLDETWVDISTWDNLLPLSLEAEKHSGWWGSFTWTSKVFQSLLGSTIMITNYDFLIDQQLLTQQPKPASCLRRKFRDKSATDKILRGMKRKETRTCCW